MCTSVNATTQLMEQTTACCCQGFLFGARAAVLPFTLPTPQCWLGWIRKVGNYGLPYTGKGAAPRSCRADLTVPPSQFRRIVAANCLCTWESIWLPPGTSHNWKLQVHLVVSRALGRSRLSAAVCIVVVRHRRIKPCSAAAILIF
jgi:hypothetical protein